MSLLDFQTWVNGAAAGSPVPVVAGVPNMALSQ